MNSREAIEAARPTASAAPITSIFIPRRTSVVVFGERGKVYLVPLHHISELAYQHEDLAE